MYFHTRVRCTTIGAAEFRAVLCNKLYTNIKYVYEITSNINLTFAFTYCLLHTAQCVMRKNLCLWFFILAIVSYSITCPWTLWSLTHLLTDWLARRHHYLYHQILFKYLDTSYFATVLRRLTTNTNRFCILTIFVMMLYNSTSMCTGGQQSSAVQRGVS